MSCPRCNGTSRDAIAPNYWRCTSPVIRHETRYSPGPAADQWGRVIVSVPVQCGFEYQETNSSAIHGNESMKCWCGLFAIGECVQCGAPFCGTPGHRNVLDGRNLCLACARVERDKARHLQSAAMRDCCEQRVAERLSGFIHYLSGIEQPAARFVALVFQSVEAISRLNKGGYVASEMPSGEELDSAFVRGIGTAFHETRFQELLSASPGDLRQKVDGDFLREQLKPIICARWITVPVTGVRRGFLFNKTHTIRDQSGWYAGSFPAPFSGGDNGDWDMSRSELHYLVTEDFAGIYHLSGPGLSPIQSWGDDVAPTPWSQLPGRLAGKLVMNLVGVDEYEWRE